MKILETFTARQGTERIDEVPIAQKSRLLKSLDGLRDASYLARFPKEMIEKGAPNPVFIYEQ